MVVRDFVTFIPADRDLQVHFHIVGIYSRNILAFHDVAAEGRDEENHGLR